MPEMKKEAIRFRISTEDRVKIEKKAESHGLRLSEYIRMMVLLEADNLIKVGRYIKINK